MRECNHGRLRYVLLILLEMLINTQYSHVAGRCIDKAHLQIRRQLGARLNVSPVRLAAVPLLPRPPMQGQRHRAPGPDGWQEGVSHLRRAAHKGTQGCHQTGRSHASGSCITFTEREGGKDDMLRILWHP